MMGKPQLDSPRVPAQQMALRVAMIAMAAFLLFGIVFFRLWYLQVLDGGRYLAEARANHRRPEPIQAPRGVIRDANGRVLVENRPAATVTLDPRTVPQPLREEIAAWGQAYGRWTKRAARAVGDRPVKPEQYSVWRRKAERAVGQAPPMPRASGDLWALYERLGRVLDRSPQRINTAVVAGLVQVPWADVTLKSDVSSVQRQYIGERQEQFPGVAIKQVYARRYPQGDLAPQVLGSVGEISPKQLDWKHFKGLKQGAIVGQGGLEYQYDRYLRGTDGEARLEVNALGQRRGTIAPTAPKQGRNLSLTLDASLQRAGQDAMQALAPGMAGAFVAMNPKTGAVYALGSLPTYNPRALAGPFDTTAEYMAQFGDAAGRPLIDRAIQSVYPTGSTFKPVTALAGLSDGTITTSGTYVDNGCIKIGRLETDVACNDQKIVYGPVDLVRALAVSSDTYFYNIGITQFHKRSWAIQDWARKLGFGQAPQVDLPGAKPGTIPSPKVTAEFARLERECRKKKRAPCGIAYPDAVYVGGDQVHFAVGQGMFQASPLQLAIAYSTIINGGTVPVPHLGQAITDQRGIVQRIEIPAARRVKIDPAWRDAIMRGLIDAANGPGGTSRVVWDGWPRHRFPVAGKTGTAQVTGGAPQSWYAGYSYRGSPGRDPIVFVVTVEHGGYGAEMAAPIGRLLLSKYFGVKPEVHRGTATQ